MDGRWAVPREYIPVFGHSDSFCDLRYISTVLFFPFSLISFRIKGGILVKHTLNI